MIATLPYPLAGKRVWVAGHAGMVGSALVERLASEQAEVLTVERGAVDLRDQAAVRSWMDEQRPDAVFIAAATVGGIEANRTRPAEFLYDNLMIAANVIHAAAGTGVSKLMFLGSSCFYPREARNSPVREGSILTGPLEPTNEWYAVAKSPASVVPSLPAAVWKGYRGSPDQSIRAADQFRSASAMWCRPYAQIPQG